MAIRLFILLGLLAQQVLILPCAAAIRLERVAGCASSDDESLCCCIGVNDQATCGCMIAPEPLPQPQPITFQFDFATFLALPTKWIQLPKPTFFLSGTNSPQGTEHLAIAAQTRCAVLCCWLK